MIKVMKTAYIRDGVPREGALSPARGMSRRQLFLEGDTAGSET